MKTFFLASPMLNKMLPFNILLVQQFHLCLILTYSNVEIHIYTHKYTHTWKLSYINPDIFRSERLRDFRIVTHVDRSSWYSASRLADSKALPFPFSYTVSLSLLFNTKNNNSTYIISFFKVPSHILLLSVTSTTPLESRTGHIIFSVLRDRKLGLKHFPIEGGKHF